ncbi:MAG: cobalamin B12-binding domain-containing protein [Alphaproteobacteria bacterium]|nr:cobalamin B12-binding domain-containing protein [Alphaproteobacteria bacterium]
MRVLLINPAMNLQKLGRFAGLLEPMPPTGLAYIAGALEHHGVTVRALDMFADKLSGTDIVDAARRFRPDLIGMTVLTPSAPVCEMLVKMLRVALPEAKHIWGGVHADVFGKEIVRDLDVDFCVHHDGEHTVCELVDALAAGEVDFSSIDGLTWKTTDGEPVTNKARTLLRDLDSLPYPAWHLFPIHRYGLLPFADIAKPILTMAGSRGCPYRCDYCSLIHTGGKTYRRRDPIKIVDEYEYLVDRYGVKQIGFIDPIFPLVKKDLKPLCEEIVRRGLDKQCVWLSETRADRLDQETCELMYYGGCRRVLMGIESGVDLLLGNVNKTLTTDKVREGVRNAHDAGIQTVGLFMIGLPGETPELTRETIDFAVDLDLDFAKFAITVPFPGSKLFEDRWQKDLFRDDWENYTTFNPDPDRLIYHPQGYDPEELIRMQAYALRRFYMRRKQIKKQLVDLRTISPKMLLYGLYGMAI